jgi:hypothetical protein
MNQESLRRRRIGDEWPRSGCFVLIREEMNYESKEDSGSEKIHPAPQEFDCRIANWQSLPSRNTHPTLKPTTQIVA